MSETVKCQICGRTDLDTRERADGLCAACKNARASTLFFQRKEGMKA